MPSNKQNRHKLETFQQSVDEDVMVLQETGCKNDDRPWTGHDDTKIIQNNVIQDDSK